MSQVYTGRPLPLTAIGTSQAPWRPFLRTAAQCTNAAVLSGGGAYTNLTSFPSTSTDFSSDPKIVTPITEPASLFQAQFYALAAAGVVTGTGRVWGIREARSTLPLAGVDAPQLEVGGEFTAHRLFDMSFRVGNTLTGATSKIRPYAGGTWRWIDLIGITNNASLPPGPRLIADASAGVADGASCIVWDTLGYCGFILELRIGAGITALGGEYSIA